MKIIYCNNLAEISAIFAIFNISSLPCQGLFKINTVHEIVSTLGKLQIVRFL